MKGQEDPLALEAAGRKRRLFLLRCASVSSGRADGLPSWSLPQGASHSGFPRQGVSGTRSNRCQDSWGLESSWDTSAIFIYALPLGG